MAAEGMDGGPAGGPAGSNGPAPSAAPRRQLPEPPRPAAQAIDSLLTVILTTSPTPSAPSTDLVAAVLASFRAHCPALLACPVIVVFDTYDHIGPQLRLKKGCVTPVEAANYDAYKANVKQLVGRTWGGIDDGGQDAADTAIETGLAEYGSPMIADNAVPFTIMRTAGGRIAFVEPTQRLGFGLAVRTAVRAATTPYVWVQQHDWTLAADIPVAAMLDAMQTAENAIRTAENAVGDGGGGLAESAGEDPTPTKELFETSEDDRTPGTPGTPGTPSTPGSPAHSVPEEHTSALDPSRPVAIRYICLPSVRMLRYATSAHAVGFPTLRSLTAAFKRDVPVSSSVLASGSRASRSGDNAGHSQNLPLTPLFFWHDKTHIAARDHYLRRVFASRLALGRGDFIEDHIGQRARAQMKRDPAAWHRWACWLYYPDNGNRLCLRHLQGRTWRGEQQEQAIRDAYVLRNRSAASAAAAAAMAAAETKAKQQYGTTDDVTRGADHGWHAMPFGSDEEAS